MTTPTKRAASRRRTHVDGIVVIGGGYAGVHAARAARDRGASVTVLDPTGSYDFVPRLAAIAGGTAPESDASAPLDRFVDQVHVGSAVAVGDGTVDLEDGSRWSADAVIVTAGAVPTAPPIDGLDRAWPLRTGDHARVLRQAIGRADALVVVGGGATGVQLAGAAAAAHRDLTVAVVEASGDLLAGMGELGGHAARILDDAGVDVRLGASVASVEDDGVTLESGERLTGVVVWAAGFEARADQLGLDVDDGGRAIVTPDLRVAGLERTFAAGDIAHHVDRDGATLPMSAQIAVRAGAAAGRNAARLMAGAEPESVELTQLGWVLDLGGWRGVAQIGPFAIASSPLDRLAPLLHAAIDVKHLSEVGGLGAVCSFGPNGAGRLNGIEPAIADVLRRALGG